MIQIAFYRKMSLRKGKLHNGGRKSNVILEKNENI